MSVSVDRTEDGKAPLLCGEELIIHSQCNVFYVCADGPRQSGSVHITTKYDLNAGAFYYNYMVLKFYCTYNWFATFCKVDLVGAYWGQVCQPKYPPWVPQWINFSPKVTYFGVTPELTLIKNEE